MKSKRGQTSLYLIHVIVGILLISGGILYLFSQSSLGGIFAGFGLLFELIIKYVGNIK